MLLETGVDSTRSILFGFRARPQLKMEQATPYVQAQPRIGEKANANGGKRQTQIGGKFEEEEFSVSFVC